MIMKNAQKVTYIPRALRSGYGYIGASVLLLLVIVAIAAPIIAPFPPGYVTNSFLSPPSATYWLGTDEIGRDLFTEILYGARITLIVGASAAFISFGLGVFVGSISGYARGRTDTILMKISEFFQIIPSLILALIFVAMLGTQLWLIILAIGITIWPQQSRIVRAQFLSLREREFVQAARVLGFSDRHIISREILPNALGPIFVQATLDVGIAILLETALSFLGLGDPNLPSWGQILSGAQQHLGDAWWIAAWPGLCIALAVLAVNLLGDSMNEHYNTRSNVGKASLVRRHRTAAQASLTPASASGTADDVLTVQDLVVHVRRGKKIVHAVEGVSIAVRHGQRVGIVGESGSGKSMTAHAILGMIPSLEVERFSGRIELDGVDLTSLGESALRRARRTDLSIVFQDAMTYLNPTMRVGKQIAEAVDRTRYSDVPARIREVLQSVSLSPSREFMRKYPHELSGGMRQRVLIAIALVNQPKLLIADEPTTALDVTVQAQVLRTIAEVQRSTGMALLIVSHDLGVIAQMCDWAYVMHAGQVVESASVEDLFRNPQHPHTQALIRSAPGTRGKMHQSALEDSVADLPPASMVDGPKVKR